MTTGNRPLSPHLQVYRPQVTSVVSILHRITGVGMAFGSIFFVYWIGAAAYGPEAFAASKELMTSWLGIMFLFGWSFAAYFHMCNGIRHLFWDVGLGFEKEQYASSGRAVFVCSIILTIITWLIV
ncbi:MAG: succinate dehydrogenase, cytochrome b556 subunit [Alphaproteobacteria bacterium]|nr:succinate dehydrogenase, cytochrome b556 subunit [Alphaproteobacteria bacterium]